MFELYCQGDKTFMAISRLHWFLICYWLMVAVYHKYSTAAITYIGPAQYWINFVFPLKCPYLTEYIYIYIFFYNLSIRQPQQSLPCKMLYCSSVSQPIKFSSTSNSSKLDRKYTAALYHTFLNTCKTVWNLVFFLIQNSHKQLLSNQFHHATTRKLYTYNGEKRFACLKGINCWK